MRAITRELEFEASDIQELQEEIEEFPLEKNQQDEPTQEEKEKELIQQSEMEIVIYKEPPKNKGIQVENLKELEKKLKAQMVLLKTEREEIEKERQNLLK